MAASDLPHEPNRLRSKEDARLVAMLTMLRDHLAPVVDEITFGELSDADRRELARALRQVADTLDLTVAVTPESTAR